MKKLIALLLIASLALSGCVDAPQRRSHPVPVTTRTTTTTTTTDASGNKVVVVEQQTAPQHVIVVREYPYYGPYYQPNWHFGINWVFGGGHGHRR